MSRVPAISTFVKPAAHHRRRFPVMPGMGVIAAMMVSGASAHAANGHAMQVMPEETYTSIQAAFLQEQFARVVERAQPLFTGSSESSSLASQDAEQASRTTRVWLWYCLSLERLKRFNDALREIDRLKASLSQQPSSTAAELGADRFWPEVLFWEGEISRKASQLRRAQGAYQRLMANFPNSMWRSRAQIGLGLIGIGEQRFEEASQQFQDVLAASPSVSIAREALLFAGVCDVHLKRSASALARFRQLLDQPLDPPFRAQVAYYIGETLTDLQQFDDAVGAYQQAIDADAASGWAGLAQVGRGWAFFKLQRCSESLHAFEEYLTRPDAQPAAGGDVASRGQDVRLELLFAQGHCWLALGDEHRAGISFEALRTDYPDHPMTMDALISLADLRQRQGRASEARGWLERVVAQAREPGQRQRAQVRLGTLWLAEGDTQQAASQFYRLKEASELEIRQAALNGLGDVQMALGHSDEAERWYQQAIRAAPSSSAALYASYQLGRLKLQLGDVEEATQRFQQLAQQPDQTIAMDARLALAFAWLSQSRPETARRELETLRTQQPTSPHAARAGYYLALLALQDGDLENARGFCEETIQRAPRSDEAFEAHLLLADLLASQASPEVALAALQTTAESFRYLAPRHQGRLAKKFGDLAHQTHAYVQAIHWYETAWELSPALRGELDYRIASCYEEGGDLEAAMARYRAITQAPWRIRGRLVAAKLLEREGQWQEAMGIYELIAQEPVPEAKIAQERLSVLGGEHLVKQR